MCRVEFIQFYTSKQSTYLVVSKYVCIPVNDVCSTIASALFTLYQQFESISQQLQKLWHEKKFHFCNVNRLISCKLSCINIIVLGIMQDFFDIGGPPHPRELYKIINHIKASKLCNSTIFFSMRLQLHHVSHKSHFLSFRKTLSQHINESLPYTTYIHISEKMAISNFKFFSTKYVYVAWNLLQ